MACPDPPPGPSSASAARSAAPIPATQAGLLSAIKDLAQLLRLEVDGVRELTYRADFPQPIKIGRRWLWFPDDVLPWTREQGPRAEVSGGCGMTGLPPETTLARVTA